MATNNGNAIIIDDCNKRIAGVKKYIDPNADIPVDGKVVKAADIIAVFQADIDARNGVTALQAQVSSAIAARKPKDALRKIYDRALKAYVGNRFGDDSTEAHALGYPPPKPKKASAETKAEAVQKSKATRAARHTIAPTEKAKLKGTTEVAITPDQAAALAAGEATASVVLVPTAPEHGAAPAPDAKPATAGNPPAASNGASHA